LLERQGAQFPNSLSPDGRLLAFSELSPGVRTRDIWVMPLEGDRTPTPFLTTPFNERSPAFSPDGQWIAYVSDESGNDEVYVQPYPGPGGKLAISTSGGVTPVWSPGGGEIFYLNGDQMFAVTLETEPTLNAGKPRLLFEGQYVQSEAIPQYDVSSDGQHFVMIQSAQEAAPTELHVVLNWFEELKRLAPYDE
jgi:serine/threonine-protein kinase